MTRLLGQVTQRAALLAALRGGALHHAWLLAGPRGVGKAAFARDAARAMLVEAAMPGSLGADLDVPPGSVEARLFDAGTHPDFRLLQRLPKDPEKPDQDIARSIPVAQIRTLLPMLANKPARSPRRVIVIDAVDDLERPGASNALLKSLEEPPAGTIFLLVSHAPGRLLPTIRSRCRVLRFDPLGEADMTAALTAALPAADANEVAALVGAGGGSPGLALGYAGLDIAGLDAAVTAIAGDGDPTNARRVKLARELSGKAAQPRYEAFLDRVPTLIAAAARGRTGAGLRTALDAHRAAGEIAGSARGLSLDAQATVFEVARVVATLAGQGASPRP